MKIVKRIATLILGAGFMVATAAMAAQPVTRDGVTTIHLDEYNGYFAAQETLASLKPGTYEFVITNKAGKVVGFLLQDAVTHERLAMMPLEPGQTRTATAEISTNGFRYRCPINPTPWYDVSVNR